MQAACAAVLLWLAPLLAGGQDAAVLTADIERIAGTGWQVSRLSARVGFAASGMNGQVDIGQLDVPAADLSLADVRIRCGVVTLSASRYTCDRAHFDAVLPALGRQTIAGSLVYERGSGNTRFELADVPLAGSRLSVQGSAGETAIEIGFDGNALQLDGLLELAAALGIDAGTVTATGRADISGRLVTSAGGHVDFALQAGLLDAAVSNDTGTAVTDALHGTVSIDAARRNGRWRFDADLAADGGEVYVEPVYANLSDNALRVQVANAGTADFSEFAIDELRVEQDRLLTLTGSARVTLPQDDEHGFRLDGRFDFTDTAVEAVYTSVLQILAAGSILGDLETSGRVSGSVTIDNNVPVSAALAMRDVVLDDRQRRFALYGLAGDLYWPGPDGEPDPDRPSELRWDSAAAYSIAVGGGALSMVLGGNDVQLLAPLRLPTMGGALHINRLRMNNYGEDDASGLLDAELEPIQLGQLSGAFGWPAFSGSLSGKLPLLQYDGNAMTVGGRLTANAFDGRIEVSNLRLEQPFGRVPRLYGDLHLDKLDLERITNTFSFGLIQGRLSGAVTGLQMTDWRPVAMDLHLYTPADDPARHRISQRAVENLASVGGSGAAAALSSGFLKFFEVFAYDRIALRCVLDDGVCEMSGAGPAGEGPLGEGYYIVKGSGLPRIDVIGYRRQVSWTRLLQQLAAITRSDAPVVN